jgi:hypothetical protein
MRTAETVLGVIQERGRRRLPLENLYRPLYNRDLFLHAYGRLYRNAGALPPRRHDGNRRRDVTGQDRCAHRSLAPGTVSVDASQVDLHPEEIGQTPPSGPADVPCLLHLLAGDLGIRGLGRAESLPDPGDHRSVTATRIETTASGRVCAMRR